MAKIIAPNKDFNNISAGIMFEKGVGECTDPYLISWFKEKGYEVVEETGKETGALIPVTGTPAAETKVSDPVTEKPLNKMNKTELLLKAQKMGLELTAEQTKAEIIKAIEDNAG